MKFAKRWMPFTCLFAFGVLGLSPAKAEVIEVIELKTGHKIEGDVLKQQGELLFVDIGFEIVKVPVNQIKSRVAAKDSANAPAIVQKHQLYRTAQLPRRSIKELTENS